MKHNKQLSCFLLLIVLSSLYSCGGEKGKTTEPTTPITESMHESPSPAVLPSSVPTEELEIRTFEVIDSTTKSSKGWGYDLYVDKQRMIHQPIIPAIPGNKPFSSEDKAKRAGLFAIAKIKKTGSLPVLTVEELDSLGVIK
jgi:hypothetical protein